MKVIDVEASIDQLWEYHITTKFITYNHIFTVRIDYWLILKN